MRKKIVAGNWKMNKTLQEGVELAKEVNCKVKAANAARLSSTCRKSARSSIPL